MRNLKAVRQKRRLSLEDVARASKTSPDRLSDFESGKRRASQKQLDRLAEIYGIPSYLLFGDSLPNLPETPRDFRKATPGPADISALGQKALWAIEQRSSFSAQLAVELDYKPRKLSNTVTEVGLSPTKRAAKLRDAFSKWATPRREQLNFSGSREHRLFGELRLFFEIHGGVLSVADAPPSDFIGFYAVPDGCLPTIFVNRKISSKKAQLFTLLHEYCHSLLQEDGLSNPFVVRNSVERYCNQFAAEYLAPIDDFSKLVDDFPEEDFFRLIRSVSSSSLLSNHATAIRLLESGRISQSQLSAWESAMAVNPRAEKDEEKEGVEEQGGGVPHATRISMLGHLPVYLADLAVKRKMIDSLDVQFGIGLSTGLQARAFSLAARRFAVALRE